MAGNVTFGTDGSVSGSETAGYNLTFTAGLNGTLPAVIMDPAAQVGNIGLSSAGVVSSISTGPNGVRFGSSSATGIAAGLVVTPSGNVGVYGEASPAHPLQLPGATFRVTADGAMYQTSTRAAKHEIKPLASQLAWELVTGLEAVTYRYKSSGEFHTGFIAEDVPAMLAQLLPPEQRHGLSELDLVAALCGVVKRHMELGRDMHAEAAMLSQILLDAHAALEARTGLLDAQQGRAAEITAQARNLSATLAANVAEALRNMNTAVRITELKARVAAQNALQSELDGSLDRLNEQVRAIRDRASRRAKLQAQLEEQAAQQQAAIKLLQARL